MLAAKYDKKMSIGCVTYGTDLNKNLFSVHAAKLRQTTARWAMLIVASSNTKYSKYPD